MIEVLVLLAAFVLAMVISEVVLNGTKLQTGLRKALIVYALIGIALIYHLMSAHGGGIVTFAIFWMGAFLSWFGVRSHVESSILLRMIYFLSERPLTRLTLLARYESSYGVPRRVEELCRAGLVERVPSGITITRKGRFIVGLSHWLR